jgi:hypothetical protein
MMMMMMMMALCCYSDRGRDRDDGRDGGDKATRDPRNKITGVCFAINNSGLYQLLSFHNLLMISTHLTSLHLISPHFTSSLNYLHSFSSLYNSNGSFT